MRKVVTALKQILKKGSKSKKTKIQQPPEIVPRTKHAISRSCISHGALKVLYRLHKSGFSAYLVGGSVRDLLLGMRPKDFDVVTNALPEQIRSLFKNSFIIGRRFRLVHVRFGQEIIEVATFRGATENSVGIVKTQGGLLLRDNVYGTMDDDVWRRDFTVNALYYNIADFSVVDYTKGMSDLSERCLRVIGNPSERYREDPARMLRAIRIAGKLNFEIEPTAAEAIKANRELLLHVPAARIFDKLLKIFHSGKSYDTFKLMLTHCVFSVLFPRVSDCFDNPTNRQFIETALKNTDERIHSEKTINPAFLFAALLWCPLQERRRFLQEIEDVNPYQALHQAIGEVLDQQLKIISIPRRFTLIMREIWHLQFYLENLRPKRVYKLFYHPRFRTAYDFLLIRGLVDESLQSECEWWTQFQDADEEGRDKLISERFVRRQRKRRRTKKEASHDQGVPSTGE